VYSRIDAAVYPENVAHMMVLGVKVYERQYDFRADRRTDNALWKLHVPLKGGFSKS